VNIDYSPHKTCRKCGEEKPLEEFSRAKRYKGGLHSWCKPCVAAYAREYKKKNREKINARRRKQYAADPERYNAHWRKSYETHKEKRQEAARHYYHENKEACKERFARYYHENLEYMQEKARAYREANPERVKENMQRWYEENREYERERAREYYEANKEWINPLAVERVRRWRAANPEKNRIQRLEQHNRRRARIVGSQTGRVSYAAVLERDGYICHICEGSVEPGDLHFDHVIPLAKGGPHVEDNIKVAHSSCNLRKSDKLL
jgi:5-methylcytosine-specific restriction endonuclease McrA